MSLSVGLETAHQRMNFVSATVPSASPSAAKRGWRKDEQRHPTETCRDAQRKGLEEQQRPEQVVLAGQDLGSRGALEPAAEALEHVRSRLVDSL